MRYYAARACTAQINRLTTIEVPAGTECIAVENPQGVLYAIKSPLPLIPESDTIARHDALYHYLWIDPENVTHITE